MHDVRTLRTTAMSVNWLWLFGGMSFLNPGWFFASMSEGAFVALCCGYGLIVIGAVALYLTIRMRYFDLVPDAPEMRFPWESYSRRTRRVFAGIVGGLFALAFLVGMIAARVGH